MANINIQIPDEIHKKLKIEAIEQDATLKDIIVGKLSRYAKKK